MRDIFRAGEIFKNYHDKRVENMNNWTVESYNSGAIAGGAGLYSGGAGGGRLELKDAYGSRYKYQIGYLQFGVGAGGQSDLDFETSAGSLNVKTFGGACIASVTGLWKLNATSFEGPCVVLNGGGGVSIANAGFNIVALGANSALTAAAFALSGPGVINFIQMNSKAIIIEGSTDSLKTSIGPQAGRGGLKGRANIGVNIAVGACSLIEQIIAPASAMPIRSINDGRLPVHGKDAPRSRIHTVKTGESLSQIAMKYYGDFRMYVQIYQHPENRKKIGANANYIVPGLELVIP